MECSRHTISLQENIIGSCAPVDVQFAIELSEPWDAIPNKSEHFIQQKFIFETISDYAKKKIRVGINYFAPNNFSVKGFTRVFCFKRKQNQLENFDSLELFVHDEHFAEVAEYLKIYVFENDFSLLKSWRVDLMPNRRDIFVCCHGNRDRCCGVYGLEILTAFESMLGSVSGDSVRIWKSSHLGGHRYAATFYEAPSMRWYGLFAKESIKEFLLKERHFELGNQYRGHAGCDSAFIQLAEMELFREYSWDWESFLEKSYEIKLQENGQTAVVDFVYFNKNLNVKESKSYFIELESTLNGIVSCGKNETKDIKQYKIKEVLNKK